jgi:transcriptional regulator GlxA family with amidase domain
MHRIGFVVSPGFQMMSVAALPAFEFANISANAPIYEIQVLSERGGPVRSSMGPVMETAPLDEATFDTVIFGGDLDGADVSESMVEAVRRAASAARRTASICTGAFVLAQAGLLDGRSVTTHWAQARCLAMRYPKIKLDPDRIFIVDGPIWTSAGASAGVDLALGMIENDLGPEIARLVAKKLVVSHRRAGGQSQHSVLLDMDAKSDRIQTALDYARRNLAAELSVEDLAEAASLSPRQFSRAFRAETGQSPAKAIEQLRVEAARELIGDGRHSMDEIAGETGFADRERMRRAFLRVLGQPPQTIRRHARAAAQAAA